MEEYIIGDRKRGWRRGYGECGGHSQPPWRVAEFLRDLFEPDNPAPRLPGFFLEQSRVAEGADGGVAGVSGAHAGGEVFADLLVEMELDFVV